MSEEAREGVQNNTESPDKGDAAVKEESKELSERLYPEHDSKDAASTEEGKEEPKEADGGDESETESESESSDKDGEGDDKADTDYTLDLPEGAHFSQNRLDEIAAEARELGLTKDEAEELVHREQQAISSYIEAETAALKERSARWVDEVKSDSEIGGEKYDASISHAKRIINKHASESLKQMLEDTGLGNHPEVIRLFARVGKEVANDEYVSPPQGHATQKRPKSLAERLYGETTPN